MPYKQTRQDLRIGSGEAGVTFPDYLTPEHYKSVWTAGDLEALAQVIADEYEMEMPRLVFTTPSKHVDLMSKPSILGRYWSKRSMANCHTLEMFCPHPRVLVHEMAHAVTEEVRGIIKRPGKNGKLHRVHHGKDFYEICTEVWEKVGRLVVKGG